MRNPPVHRRLDGFSRLLVAALLLTTVSACGDDRGPRSGPRPERSSTSEPSQDSEPGLDLAAWQAELEGENVGDFRTRMELPHLLIRSSGRYKISPPGSMADAGGAGESGVNQLSVPFRSTLDGSWFQMLQGEIYMGDCWANVSTPWQSDHWGYALSTSPLPAAVSVMRIATADGAGGETVTATATLGLVVASVGTRLLEGLGVRPDDRSPMSITISVEDGAIIGWSVDLAEVVRVAAETRRVTNRDALGLEGVFEVEIDPGGLDFDVTRPPENKVVTDVPEEEFVSTVARCMDG